MTPSPAFSKTISEFKDIPSAAEHINMPAERMGVLSLTLTTSPVVRWILPARIRSSQHNDVVFVGTSCIQLREFHENGQLSDATAKLDFGTQIMCAKVISAKVELIPTIDNILDQEWDEERFIIKGKPCADSQPPQIVVLATASSELIYVYARNSSIGNTVEFVFARRALLEDMSIPERYFRHMAIDPEYKMMAVASYNSCTVFSLKEVDDLKSSIDSWDPRKAQAFCPNIEQRMIQTDGHILRMDFLRASEEEPEKVVLLFIVAKNGSTFSLTYTWDSRDPLDQMQPMNGWDQNLLQEDEFPLLLIPTKKRTSFAIVTEDNMIFYDNIQSQQYKARLSVNLPAVPPGKPRQLWVQWAKPSRHDSYNNQKEDILLIREDGLLKMFLRPHGPRSFAITNFSPGTVPMTVDSAMCMLPGPRSMGGDILIVGGSMCDGGVFHLQPRRAIETLQVISNISPIHHVATMDSATTKQKDVRARRTFVAAGVAGASSLTELRFGREAQIGLTAPFAESGTMTRIWAFEHNSSERVFILASHPEYTTALAFDFQNPGLDQMDSGTFPGLELDVPTLAAAMLSSGITVQITSKSISLDFETESPQVEVIENAICAAVDRLVGTFAIACKRAEEYDVRVGLISRLEIKASLLTSPACLHSIDRPLCMALSELSESHLLSIGYLDGRIEVFSIDGEGSLKLESTLNPTESDAAAITSIVILSHPSAHHGLMLAGTRDGKLKAVKVTYVSRGNQTKIGCDLDRTYQVGSTTVTVIDERRQSNGNLLGALVMCGQRLDQVTCFKNEDGVDYMLTSIWLSMRNDLSYVAPNLNAVCGITVPKCANSSLPSRLLICATTEDLVFADLIEQEQIVPRRLDLDEKKVGLMVFSRILNKFVVANNTYTTSLTTGSDEDYNSEERASLQVIDADEVSDNKKQDPTVILGKQEEQVKVLLPWEPTDGKIHYDLIVVGLSNGQHSRLGFVSAKKFLPNAKTPASFKLLMRFTNKELHAICAVDKSTLGVSVGYEIVLVRLDFASKKWFEDARYGLPSAALSLSAQSTVIYAATEKHSTIVLSWHRDARRFEKLLTDRAARNARTVLPFGKNGDHLLATTAIDPGTSILAYSIKRNSLNTPSPLFEAEIPLSIDHIMCIPSSWPDGHQYAFQGVAADGTVFVFETLTYNEWRLLRYVEQLVYPDVIKSAKRSMALLTEQMARNDIRVDRQERAAYFNAKKMHVNGDVLKRLVEQGPQRLRGLLGAPIKHEDDMNLDEVSVSISMLETLAKPVLGEVSDLAGAVIAWMRRILRSTIF